MEQRKLSKSWRNTAIHLVMSDESWSDKRPFKIYTEGKIPKTIKTLEKQRIKEVSKNNERKGYSIHIIGKVIKAMCENFEVGNKRNKNTLEVEGYRWTD